MKNMTCLAVALMIFLPVLFAQKDGYEIKIEVKGLKEGDKCILGNYFGDKQLVQDTAFADKRGRLVFSGDEKKPGGIYFIVLPQRQFFEILLDEDQHFTIKTDIDDLLHAMKVKNSKDNKLFYEYQKFISNMQKKVEGINKKRESQAEGSREYESLISEIHTINEKVKDYKNNIIENHPDFLLSKILLATKDIEIPDMPLLPDGTKDSLFPYRYYKENYFRYFDFSDERLLRTPVFHRRLDNYVKNVLMQVSDTIINVAEKLIERTDGNRETFKYLVWYFTNYGERSNIMGMDAVFVHMAEQYYLSNKAFWVGPEQLKSIADRVRVLKPLLIGSVAPNITVVDSVNRAYSLHDVQAKYTVLYIWSTDCGHCKRMTPILKDFYLENRDKGLEVFALCTETDLDEWKRKVRKNNVDWINVWDPLNRSNYRDLYDVYSTPILYLLDEEKRIIAKRIDAEQLKGFLERMMSEELDYN